MILQSATHTAAAMRRYAEMKHLLSKIIEHHGWCHTNPAIANRDVLAAVSCLLQCDKNVGILAGQVGRTG